MRKKRQNTQTEFPWWDDSASTNTRWEKLSRLSPGLIIALSLSALFFVVEFNFPAPESATQQMGSSSDITQQNPQNAGNTGVEPTLASRSLLADLFGFGAVDPLFQIPDVVLGGEEGINEQPADPAAGETEPDTEPQRSIWRYLVAASDIGFENNESRLSLALATAEQGETDAMNNFIADLEAKLLEYAALVPPEELSETHAASLAVVERYINHLRASRDKVEGSVEDTWHSPERDAIAEEANRINQQIRDIVHNTGTVLPAGVLP